MGSVSCNIKIIAEKKKFAGQNEKIFIFAALKNPPVWGVLVRESRIRRLEDRRGREFNEIVIWRDSSDG